MKGLFYLLVVCVATGFTVAVCAKAGLAAESRALGGFAAGVAFCLACDRVKRSAGL